MPRKHSHYFRPVTHLRVIDIYRFLDLFNVTDQALGHAIKKLVVPGMRGGNKTSRKDIEEAIDTLQRKLEMMDEDAAVEKAEASDQGEWRAWFGSGEHPTADCLVDVRLRSGVVRSGVFSRGLDWRHNQGHGDIIAYRMHVDVL